MRDYFGRLGEIFEKRRVESVEITDVDESRVLAVVRIVGKSSTFGEVDAEWAWLITTRKGQLEPAPIVAMSGAESPDSVRHRWNSPGIRLIGMKP